MLSISSVDVERCPAIVSDVMLSLEPESYYDSCVRLRTEPLLVVEGEMESDDMERSI